MKIYTKTGDQGTTSLWSGKRVSKAHPRIAAYGSVDELNSCLGIVIASIENENHISQDLELVQNHLFLMGSFLSCDKKDLAQSLAPLEIAMAEHLEARMDKMDESLNKLTQFILPGGSLAASHAHMARCVCRRAERQIVACEDEILYKEEILIYLNRLSDYLFVAARYLNHKAHKPDKVWDSQLFKK